MKPAASTTSGNAYGVDEHGHQIVWSSCGQQVMMEWERAYMEACVDALAIQRSDRVLEVGFGLAYSATRIQSFRPKSHTIIECDREAIARSQQFAAQYSDESTHVCIVEGTWQSILPSLGEFDCVFFDDYPLPEIAATAAVHEHQEVKRSRWHGFLDAVLHHTARGARITGYLARLIDLGRRGCHVTVTKYAVHAAKNCVYYPHEEAYIPVISVLDPALARNSKQQHLARERMLGIREDLLLQDVTRAHEDANETDVNHCAPISERGVSATDHAVAPDQYAEYGSRAQFVASLRSRAQMKSYQS